MLKSNLMSHQTIIIGGGVVGLSCAIALKKKGVDITLIERAKPGHTQACSYGNAGWLTPCFATPLPMPGVLLKSIGWLLDPNGPLYIQPRPSIELIKWLIQFALACNKKQFFRATEGLVELSKFTLQEFEKFSREKKLIQFEKKGLIVAAQSKGGLKSAMDSMKIMESMKIEGRVLSLSELTTFEPALRSNLAGAVYYPNEAHIEPRAAVLALYEQAQELGINILTNQEVYDFSFSDPKNGFRVLTTLGQFTSKNIIIASGSWSNLLGRRFGIKLPLLGGKGYAMTIENSTLQPKHPILCVEKKIAITPKTDGALRLAGTLELVDQNFGISANRVHAIEMGSRDFIRLPDQLQVREIWRGLRPCTSDGVPLIGWSSKVAGLFWCTGHQMLGLQSSLGSARLAAELFTHSQPFVDPFVFDPGRYGA